MALRDLKSTENKPEKKGLFNIVLIVIILILVAIIVILITYNSFKFPTLQNPETLNIFLTSALVFFGSIEAASTISKYKIEKKRKRSLDLRNELEKLYGPIYSVLNKVVYDEERKGVLTQSEKKMLDETFSKEPFTLTSQEEWRLKIRNQKTTDIDMKFIEKFNKEYESKKEKEAIEKQFSLIYSMFKNVSQNVETIGILLPYEKTMIDKKFSTYPFMLNQELYDYWNKEIRPLQITIGYKAFEHRITLYENLKLDESEATTKQGVYLIPKAFISKFLEEYGYKVYEYRKL